MVSSFMNLCLSFKVFSGMICLVALFLIYLQVAFVIFLMAVPLSHCNTLRNAFTEEDLTPIVENLKWDDKEEQTAMADYFHQKSSDPAKKYTKVSCKDVESISNSLKENCPNSCRPTYDIDCKILFCTSCNN